VRVLLGAGRGRSPNQITPLIESSARWRFSNRLGHRFDGLPTDVRIVARPGVNFGSANLTAEFVVGLLGEGFLSSLISRAALWADEYYGDGLTHFQTRIGAVRKFTRFELPCRAGTRMAPTGNQRQRPALWAALLRLTLQPFASPALALFLFETGRFAKS